MGTSDLSSDFRERRITHTAIIESVFRHGDLWVRPCHSHTSRAPGFRLRPDPGRLGPWSGTSSPVSSACAASPCRARRVGFLAP